MRYGHRLNMSIPPSAAAEFHSGPWPDRVVIRVKSAAAAMAPPTASVAGGPLAYQRPPPHPGSWRLAQPSLSTVLDSLGTALTAYQSLTSKLVDGSPPDPEALAELERLRGISDRDSAVHKAIS
jgi:hypothetical protein